MKFNIFMRIRGPGGVSDEIPNTSNPVEAADMQECLHLLADNLPTKAVGVSITVVGVRIIEAD